VGVAVIGGRAVCAEKALPAMVRDPGPAERQSGLAVRLVGEQDPMRCHQRDAAHDGEPDGIHRARWVVTPYLRFFVGSNSPTIEIASESAPKMFSRYARRFDDMWNLAKDWN